MVTQAEVEATQTHTLWLTPYSMVPLEGSKTPGMAFLGQHTFEVAFKSKGTCVKI